MAEIKDESSPQAKSLFEYSESLKTNNINKLFSMNKFHESIIDKAIRRCLLYLPNHKNNKRNTLRELLSKANLNYVNPEDKTTIIMLICEKVDFFLIESILKKEFIKGIMDDIDLSLCDNYNRNCLFYLLNNMTFEDDALKVLNEILNYNNTLENPKKSSSELLMQTDKNGNSPLTIILKKGWEKLLILYFEYVKYQNNNNNIIHFAIDGKKISCLKIILNLSTLEDLKSKNKDGDTPVVYANKKKYFYMAKFISSYESNYNDKNMKQFILQKPLNPNEILEFFSKKDFNNCLLALNQYKLNKSILGEFTDISYEWNYLLVNKNLMFSKAQYGIKPEHILSKYISNNKNYFYNDKKQIMNSLYEINKFLNKYLNEHLDTEDYPVDIFFYNKIIFYFKIGNVDSAINTIEYYLTHVSKQNEDKYYKIIIYTNVTFALIELLIKENLNEIAQVIIEKLNAKLYNCFPKNKYEEDKNIIVYLNDSEIINPFNPTWDDAFAYIHLLKILNNSASKESFEDFIKIFENCNYKEEMKIFNRLQSIYKKIKIKINYGNDYLESLNKISLLSISNVSIEDKLFFYNSVGIINLKLKKFHLAEMLFKTGIYIYKSFTLNNYSKVDVFENSILQKNDYIIFMKFNLGLSLFYQHKFQEAYEIFKELTQIKTMNKNIYLWYRLGLCSLEIYLDNMKKKVNLSKKEKKEKNIKKNEENERKVKENNKKKLYGYEFDELFNQFEEEYGNNGIKMIHNEGNQNQGNKLKKFLLRTNILNKKKYNDYLNEAIYSFKKILYIEKKNTHEEKTINLNTQYFKSIRGIYNYYSETISQDSEFKKKILSTKKKGNEEIIFLTFLNLLFSLSLAGKYTEILFICKNIQKQNFKQIANEMLAKVNYFKLEALISLGKIKESYEFMNSFFEIYNNKPNYRIEIFNKNNFNSFNELQFKSYLEIAKIILLCKENKFKEAEEKIQVLLEEFNNKKDIFASQYISNLLLYIYLKQNKKKEALEFIKYNIYMKKKE